MKTKKRALMISVICMICASFIAVPGVQAATVAQTNKKADQKFNSKMKSIRKNSQFSIRYKYVDITGDGIHEALVEYKPKTQGDSSQKFDVYTYKSGKVKRILTTTEYGLSKCTYYRQAGSLIVYGAGNGREWYRYYKLQSNGKYKYITQKTRTAIAGGSVSNGPWQYYKGGSTLTKITAKKFNNLNAGLKKGKRLAFSKWKELT